LKLARGLARAARAAGARLHENSQVLDWRETGGRVLIRTAHGEVSAAHMILSGDGELRGLASGQAKARVATLANYIAVTESLPSPHAETLLPGGEAAADSRFVINYWRKTHDGRLLFGGGETYGAGSPADIAAFVRRPMLKVYPRLRDVQITHAWGGRLGVTMHRMPYVRALSPRVLISAGYSGQGVMLAPHFGKLLGQAIAGQAGGLDLLSRLPAPPFPGGALLREPVLAAGMSYYALRDQLG
jgi:gamma-glutamylputrescine oxidase